jgi:hypothetical protein
LPVTQEMSILPPGSRVEWATDKPVGRCQG